jgi:Putative restriction endonuclease
MTLDRFLALPDREGKQEFDRGRIIELPPPKYVHSLTAKKIYDRLALVMQGKGLTVFSETGFLLAPDVVRQPDVAVVEEARLKVAKAESRSRRRPIRRRNWTSKSINTFAVEARLFGWHIRSAKRSCGLHSPVARFTRSSIELAKRFQRISFRPHANSIRRNSSSEENSWRKSG